jgi:hypothetical protein
VLNAIAVIVIILNALFAVVFMWVFGMLCVVMLTAVLLSVAAGRREKAQYNLTPCTN